MYVCAWVRGCVYVCMYMHVCMHACVYVCMHVCMYACICVCMHACMYACNIFVRIYVCVMYAGQGVRMALRSGVFSLCVHVCILHVCICIDILWGGGWGGAKKAWARISDIVGASSKGGQAGGGDTSGFRGDTGARKPRGAGTATLSSMMHKDGNGVGSEEGAG